MGSRGRRLVAAIAANSAAGAGVGMRGAPIGMGVGLVVSVGAWLVRGTTYSVGTGAGEGDGGGGVYGVQAARSRRLTITRRLRFIMG